MIYVQILSALFVARNGAAGWTLQRIVLFAILRGFAGATSADTQAIYAEEFDDSETTAAMSAFTMSSMIGSSAMFAIGPYFSIEVKSAFVAFGATLAGIAMFMAVGRHSFMHNLRACRGSG